MESFLVALTVSICTLAGFVFGACWMYIRNMKINIRMPNELPKE